MNIQECEILLDIVKQQYVNQRVLAEQTGYSLGMVNKVLKSLTREGYLDGEMKPTSKSFSVIEDCSPQNAIILAAGFGMRMVPINQECPKALIEIDGQPLIHRLIEQLREAEIEKIYVVVGFMKERFEYLIDEYNVELIVNSEYSAKNNLHSLLLTKDILSNTYIIPSDIWCKDNPFSKKELYSWYMVSDKIDVDSTVRVNRKRELVIADEDEYGNTMLGISYLTKEHSRVIKNKLIEFGHDRKYDGCFWEETLNDGGKYIVNARVVSENDAMEINTYEQLREIDEKSNQLKSDAIDVICETFEVHPGEITDIQVLKKGMTNRSFLFSCKGDKYIMRIPGEGTEKLINRKEEADVYSAIADEKICDDIAYINSSNGYKITKYFNDARVCNPDDINDLTICMKKLREFHSLMLKVEHDFDIYKQIEFYESLWDGNASIYIDYEETKKKVYMLKNYIDACEKEKCLVHIDAVPDNFLFVKDESQKEEVRLIDWEYSGMQDPHVDIAMFCIYSLYDRQQIDRLIDIYFENKCSTEIRVKIYCYVSICGFLWSNWCEYKRLLGVEFGEYSLRQYRYAKEYYKIAVEELAKKGETL